MCRKNDNVNFGARQDAMLRRSNTRNTPSHGLKWPNRKHPQSFVHHSAAKRTYDAPARNEKGRRLGRTYFCGGASGNSGSWSFGSNHDALSDRHI
jgi:hypothetical protein